MLQKDSEVADNKSAVERTKCINTPFYTTTVYLHGRTCLTELYVFRIGLLVLNVRNSCRAFERRALAEGAPKGTRDSQSVRYRRAPGAFLEVSHDGVAGGSSRYRARRSAGASSRGRAGAYGGFAVREERQARRAGREVSRSRAGAPRRPTQRSRVRSTDARGDVSPTSPLLLYGASGKRIRSRTRPPTLATALAALDTVGSAACDFRPGYSRASPHRDRANHIVTAS